MDEDPKMQSATTSEAWHPTSRGDWLAFESRVFSEFKTLVAAQARIEGRLEELIKGSKHLPRCSLLSRSSLSSQVVREDAGGQHLSRCSHSSHVVWEDAGTHADCDALPKALARASKTSMMEMSKSTSFVASTLPLDWPHVLRPRAGFEITNRGSERLSQALSSRSFCEPQGRRSQRHEERRRQGWDLFTIDPNSHFHVWYGIVSVALLVYDLTTLPYIIAWDVPFTGPIWWCAWFTASWWSLDIACNFLTGFYKDGSLVMDKRAIAKRYIRTWFWPDLGLACCDWPSLVLQLYLGADGSSRSLRMLRFSKLGRLLRIVSMIRMLRLVRILEEMVEIYVSDVSRVTLKIVSLFCGIVWCSHLLACTWFAVGRLGHSDTGVGWMDAVGIDTGDEVVDYKALGLWYQYTVAFHWAAGQISLGSVDVYPRSSLERIVNVFAMLLGFLCGSTLVSTLSAAMVDLQMTKNDRTVKLRTLKRYLRENKVAKHLAMAVRKQVELRLGQQSRLAEKDVVALSLLSSALRAELQLGIQQPHLRQHPLFRLWMNLDRNVAYQISTKVATVRFLQDKDELFCAGTSSASTFALMKGAMNYRQNPIYSPVNAEEMTEVVGGQWLCEAALWSEWTHVGKAEATAECELLVIDAGSLVGVLKQNLVVYDMAVEYCKQFHRRIISAQPPHAEFPTDLHVPFTDYCDIVISMPKELQIFVGLEALNRLPGAMRRSRGPAKGLSNLRDEVAQGESVVVVTGDGSTIRLLSLVVLSVQRGDGRLLVRVGRWDGSRVSPRCVLPALKQDREELLAESIQRAFAEKLPLLEGHVEISGTHRVTTDQLEHGVQTRYLRTVCSAQLQESGVHSLDSPTPRFEYCSQPRTSGRSEVRSNGDVAQRAAALAARLRTEEVFIVPTCQGDQNMYCWLHPEDFDFLTSSHGDAPLRDWLRCLQPVQQSLPAAAASTGESLAIDDGGGTLLHI